MLRHTTRKIATHHKPGVMIFSWLSLITSIGSAAFWTIFPLILDDTTKNESLTGLYFSLISIILLGTCVISTWLFTRYSKVWITKISMVVTIITLFGLTIADTIWKIGGLDIPRGICAAFMGISLSLFVGEYAKKNQIGLEEGKYYLFSNIGWIIGPILGGYSAKIFGNDSVFWLSGFFYFIAFLFFLHQHVIDKHPALHHEKHKESITILFQNIRKYFQKPELIKVFFMAAGMNFWWAIHGIYVPLQLENLQFDQDMIGYTVSAGYLPLVLLEHWVGRRADRQGVKKYLMAGYAILAIFVALLIPALLIPSLFILFFTMASVGAALIEPLQETYFFKVAGKKDGDRFYGIYNASDPIANIIGPTIAAGFIALGGLSLMWGGTAVILFLFFIYATRLQKGC